MASVFALLLGLLVPLTIILATALPGALQLHSLHGDGGVLQRSPALPCFTGHAAVPGDIVTITVTQVPDADSQSDALISPLSEGVGEADIHGYWRVCLQKALAASLANHTVRAFAKPSGRKATSQGNLVGDIVVCSGQSNMEKPVSYAFNATAELAAASSYAHAIRTFGIAGPWNHDAAGGAAATPQYDTKIPGEWKAASYQSLNWFSAVCWMYGRRLYEAHPTAALGLIGSHVGGTNIQAWSPPAALAACGVKPSQFNGTTFACPPYCNSSSLYNGMISPLVNYTIHHVVWYQGESNCGDATYACSQRAMVTEWRKAWRQDFPFGFVQLAGYQDWDSPAQGGSVAQLRCQQQHAANQTGTFFAIAMDLSDPAVRYDLNVTTDVHTRFKEQVGQRLALGGLAVAFGEPGVMWQGPIPIEAQTVTAGKGAACTGVRVAFENSESGVLVLKRPDLFELSYTHSDSSCPANYSAYEADWQNATAVLDGNNAIVICDPRAVNSGVSLATAVRYAQYDNPCPPTNDVDGMSPGGGGAPGKPTAANVSALVNCSLYMLINEVADGSGSMLLPSGPFWLPVAIVVV